MSFVPPSPGRWRELGRAGGAGTAHCAHASLTAPGLGTESCRLTNPLRACCRQLGSQHEQSGYLGKAVSFQRESLVCPASRIRLCVTVPRLKDSELQVSKVPALSSHNFLGWCLTLKYCGALTWQHGLGLKPVLPLPGLCLSLSHKIFCLLSRRRAATRLAGTCADSCHTR